MTLTFPTEKNITSTLVVSQLPDFVVDDAQKFTRFCQAYYRFLEQTHGPLGQLESFWDKVELTPPASADLSILSNLPVNLHSLFLQIRGTQPAYDFLMKYYGDNNSRYVKLIDIEPFSSTRYFLKVPVTVDNGIQLWVNKKIYGRTSRTTAFLKTVETFSYSGSDYHRLELTDVFGHFEIGEELVGENDIQISGPYIVQPQVINFEVIQTGYGYQAGDMIYSMGSNDGLVASVGHVHNGEVQTFNVFDGGISNSSTSHCYIDSATGRNMVFRPLVDGLLQQTISNDDLTTDLNEFTYTLRTTLDPSIYKQGILQWTNPVGFKFFTLQTLVGDTVGTTISPDGTHSFRVGENLDLGATPLFNISLAGSETSFETVAEHNLYLDWIAIDSMTSSEYISMDEWMFSNLIDSTESNSSLPTLVPETVWTWVDEWDSLSGKVKVVVHDLPRAIVVKDLAPFNPSLNTLSTVSTTPTAWIARSSSGQPFQIFQYYSSTSSNSYDIVGLVL